MEQLLKLLEVINANLETQAKLNQTIAKRIEAQEIKIAELENEVKQIKKAIA